MRQRYQVFVEGKSLDAVDPSILILSIEESAPPLQIGTAINAKYDGYRVLSRHRGALEITITVGIRERLDMAKRAAVLDGIRDWCRDGLLRVSYRPEQQIYAVCTGLPALGAPRVWNTEIEITYTAYLSPYWEDAAPTVVAISTPAREGWVNVTPKGTAADAHVTAWITAHEPVNILRVRAGENAFALENLGIPAGGQINIWRDQHDILRIMTGDNQTLMGKRHPTSADDLIIPCRKTSTLSYDSDGNATATFLVRGRYV